MPGDEESAQPPERAADAAFMRHLALVSFLALTGCSNLISKAPSSAAASSIEWGAGTTDVRRATALVRVTPPARLKAALEASAARTDDPDLSAFLRAHAGGGFGSGFVMVHTNEGGTAAFVVTNRHVIAESTEAEVSFSDGTTYKGCAVVYASTKHDLAVLALPPSAVRAIGAGLRPSTHEATDRLPIVATGYPGIAGTPSYQITDGKVSNAKFVMPELGLDDTLVQHTAPIDPGSSGGPLTDESGALVGVNVMLVRRRASAFFAVPSSAVVDVVRYAHSLEVRRHSTAWMTGELDKTCHALSSELASTTKSDDRLTSFVSNAVVADRGLESFSVLARSPFGPQIRTQFFEDPISTMRRSVIVRLGVRSLQSGGASGTCAAMNPVDAAAIAEGKPVRRPIMTKSGDPMEVLWTFEHGAWRVAGGELVELSAPPDEPKSAKESAKEAAKGKAKK